MALSYDFPFKCHSKKLSSFPTAITNFIFFFSSLARSSIQFPRTLQSLLCDDVFIFFLQKMTNIQEHCRVEGQKNYLKKSYFAQ